MARSPVLSALALCIILGSPLAAAKEEPAMRVILPNALQTDEAEWRYTTSRPPEGWEKPGFDDSSWEKGFAGFGAGRVRESRIRTPWATKDIWLRRSFRVDDAAASGFSLHIHHDDGATVFINGAEVASFDRDIDVYAHVPIDAALREGANTIAIHCHQVSGPQYIDAGLVSVGPGEKIYNGIELPAIWPPSYDRDPRKPMPVPYLKRPPSVIPIDVGRQLFVDDFLIEKTTLEREFHRPEHHPANPVVKPDRPWEFDNGCWFAAPFSGGTWYDSKDGLFKLWYTAGYLRNTALATSRDGIRWDKPVHDVARGTGLVIPGYWMKDGGRALDTSTVWLDHDDPDPAKRYKYFATEEGHGGGRFNMVYRTSADGIHWSNPPDAKHPIGGDRSTVFYNPFRKVWVLSERIGWGGRARRYCENPDPGKLISETMARGRRANWVAADDLDPAHPVEKYARGPQLYNLDATPYESLMIGQFSVWQGPDNRQCGREGLQKRNEILLGFSRDGFHWDRPDRRRFIACTWEDASWRFGNVQSAAPGFLVVGDKLYIYFCGRSRKSAGMYDVGGKRTEHWDANAATGLAFLRRDGFASMKAGARTGSLTTRPVTFKGRHLFVNVDCPGGELAAEVLDADGNVIEPFTLRNCSGVSTDKTLAPLTWRGGDLSTLAGRPVRFRFHLRNGSLYAFWVSPDRSGASHGYVGGGGPGFTGATDTVGTEAYK
ncbi:MAG: hypothetical protein ACYS9X_13410 [Planctomycetota bacterium]